ncbi:MAG: VOC family protein [Planctomycetota bacterium]
MLIGAHVIVYSKDAEADRAFFRDVLGWDHVDAGHGWLIFRLPPAEVAVHPLMDVEKHELYLMCKDIDAFVKSMADRGIACSEIRRQGWGDLVTFRLPGGSDLGVYQPRHASPLLDASP